MPLSREQKHSIFESMSDAQKELVSDAYGELKEAIKMQGEMLSELRTVSSRLNMGVRALAIGTLPSKVGPILTGEYDFQSDPELLQYLELFEGEEAV